MCIRVTVGAGLRARPWSTVVAGGEGRRVRESAPYTWERVYARRGGSPCPPEIGLSIKISSGTGSHTTGKRSGDNVPGRVRGSAPRPCAVCTQGGLCAAAFARGAVKTAPYTWERVYVHRGGSPCPPTRCSCCRYGGAAVRESAPYEGRWFYAFGFAVGATCGRPRGTVVAGEQGRAYRNPRPTKGTRICRHTCRGGSPCPPARYGCRRWGRAARTGIRALRRTVVLRIWFCRRGDLRSPVGYGRC